MQNDKLLSVEGLSINYETDSGVVRAVSNLNLSIGSAETLGIVGETGAGKTTTALGILRLIANPGIILGGKVFFKGEDLMGYTESQMRSVRGGKIAMIFQDPMTSLNPIVTVDKQIAEMIALHQAVSEKEAMSKALDMLELVGIRRERGKDYPHQFSGGMKQRVVIAIALACNPALIIADEPTTALDVTIQAQVLKLMRDLKDQFHTSMILITHDLGVVAETCDKVAIMYAGRVVEYAAMEELFDNPMHPYTLGLFGSIPDLEEEEEELKVIPGLMPDPMDLPPGCPFHPRCSIAQAECSEKEPSFREVVPGHFVACPFAKGGNS